MHNQQPKKKSGKWFIIAAIVVVIIFAWAGLTRAGFIPNFMDIEFLCSEQNEPAPVYIPNGDFPYNNFPTSDKPVIYLYPTTPTKY